MPYRRLDRLVTVCFGAMALVASLVAMPAMAATPAPSASAPSSAGRLTGHWAIAGTSGIDLVQQGTSLRGTSAAGVSISGTVAGSAVTFRWWMGGSYAAAKAADRGTGTMEISPDGERLTIAAKGDDAGPGPFPTKMDAVRVHDIITPTPTPWWYGWYSLYASSPDPIQVARVTRAAVDYFAESWKLVVETGYWPSPAVVWIKVEEKYDKAGILLIGGWLPNGGGPTLLNPAYQKP